MEACNIGTNTESDTKASDSISWQVLIVDDDEDAHLFTQLALRDLVFQGKSLNFTSAYSAEAAMPLIQAMDADLAVILLDVVMESSFAGLALVKHIRESFHNKRVQIVLRTGNSNQVPEGQVLEEYAINCYLDKSNQSKEVLSNIMLASLSNYQQRVLLEKAWLKEKALTEEMALQNKRLAKDKSDFLSYFLYEVRGPLTTIHEVAQIFDEPALSEEDKDNLQMIEHSSHQALQICEDMLIYDKLNNGNIALDCRPFNLRDLVNNVVGLRLANSSGLSGKLNYSIDQQPEEVLKGDPIRIKQMLDDALNYLLSIGEVQQISLDVKVSPLNDNQNELEFKIGSPQGQLPGQLLTWLNKGPEQKTLLPNVSHSMDIILTQQLNALMRGRIIAVNRPEGGFHFVLTVALDCGE